MVCSIHVANCIPHGEIFTLICAIYFHYAPNLIEVCAEIHAHMNVLYKRESLLLTPSCSPLFYGCKTGCNYSSVLITYS